MCFSPGKFDVADEVGLGYLFTFGNGLFGEKKYCVYAFNFFVGETAFTSTLCQAGKFVGNGTEGVERGLVTNIGVDHCGSGGNDGARFMVASVSGRTSMWSWGVHPITSEG